MKIKVCTWKTCTERFSEYILTRLKNDKERFNLDKLEIEECMCLWQCSKWPNIVVDWEIQNYMNPAKASEFAFNKNNKKK
jgi:NADH:ubiquinone oxidoreductase subunit E